MSMLAPQLALILLSSLMPLRTGLKDTGEDPHLIHTAVLVPMLGHLPNIHHFHPCSP